MIGSRLSVLFTLLIVSDVGSAEMKSNHFRSQDQNLSMHPGS